MDDAALQELVNRARAGDAEARNRVLEACRNFVFSVVGSYCRKPLAWGQDDELSVGLMAFDEAINRYEPERGVPFLAFARLVIRSRLANYFRQENRHRKAGSGTDVSEELLRNEAAAAWEEFLWQNVVNDRAEEIEEYEAVLNEFGISLEELVALSPKHRDSRMALIKAARSLAAEKKLFEQSLSKKKSLPVRDVAKKTGLSPRAVERNRKYLLALAIIFRYPERFIYLNSYINKVG
jgi:RNA polymerase sigma factor